MIEGLSTNYCGTVIEYREEDNKWYFEIDGRERSSETLALAKKIIDNPPKEKKSFKRMDAYLSRYTSNDFERVTITSIAQDGWRGSTEVWVLNKLKERRKEELQYLYPITDENDAKIAQIKELQKQQDVLREKEKTIRRSFICLSLKDIEQEAK